MGIIRRESPVEYFKEMIEAALEHQRVETGEMTSHYLVHLLAGFAMGERQTPEPDDRPLAVQMIAALHHEGTVRNALLRTIGDHSLFVSGFFSDSLKHQPADVDYYVALGACAYHSLGLEADRPFGPIFAELGARFLRFVEVLEEISERCALMTNNDLLRLYEKWLRTGNPREGERLVERGIIPTRSIGRS